MVKDRDLTKQKLLVYNSFRVSSKVIGRYLQVFLVDGGVVQVATRRGLYTSY